MIVKKDYDLTNHNGYRIQGKCDTAYIPESVEDLIEFLTQHRRKDFCIIGSGHNLILSQEYYDKKFLILSEDFGDSVWKTFETKLECYCQGGILLETLSLQALDKSASGLEYFYDIPSSLAGAIVMNAGTKEANIGGLVKWIGVYDFKENSYKRVLARDLDFQYRNSLFQHNQDIIVIDAELHLEFGNKEEILKKMNSQKQVRWSKQPRDFPNCGSVFKRPQGKYVGPMIESLGLKGFQIGGARISRKHAGFIVNAGGATGKDIIELIEFVKARVLHEFGVELESEQKII